MARSEPRGIYRKQTEFSLFRRQGLVRLSGTRLARALRPIDVGDGPNNFAEKLIPHMIIRGLAGRSLPIYCDGLNVRTCRTSGTMQRR
jgi:hypothetical protein